VRRTEPEVRGRDGSFAINAPRLRTIRRRNASARERKISPELRELSVSGVVRSAARLPELREKLGWLKCRNAGKIMRTIDQRVFGSAQDLAAQARPAQSAGRLSERNAPDQRRLDGDAPFAMERSAPRPDLPG